MPKETIILGRYPFLYCSPWFLFLGKVSLISLASQILRHPYALTLFEDSVYWTDHSTYQVVQANKWHGGNQSVIIRNIQQPLGVVAVHPVKQPDGK